MDTQPLLVLKTKLHRPPVTVETVHRKRLHEVMDRAVELPLTLVKVYIDKTWVMNDFERIE